jgi:short-subunit dehydrogenase
MIRQSEIRKVMIIGASSGIGRELARRFADEGCLVAVCGRRIMLLEELKRGNPDRYIIRGLDIQDTASLPGILEALKSELGGLDLVIISAGTGEINQSLNFDTEADCIKTNVTGFCCAATWAFKVFEGQGHGHLVGISSIGGLRGSAEAPAYNASKAFQINYLEGLRQKARKIRSKIYVTDIRPGLVDTAMAKGDGLFWVMPLEKTVNQIYKAIRKKKRIAHVSKRWAILALLIRLLPAGLYEKL